MIYLSKIEHRGETRIQVKFEKQTNLIAKIKSIESRKWSQTKRCWHLPYSKISFQSLEKVFGKENLNYPTKDNSPLIEQTSENLKSKKEYPLSNKSFAQVEIVMYKYGGEIRKKVVGEKIIIQQVNKNWLEVFVPFDKKGWQETIKNINGRKWKVENVCWEMPNVKQSYRQLKKFIGLKFIQFNFEIDKNIPEKYISPVAVFPKKKKVRVNRFDTLNEYQQAAIHQTEQQIILKRLSPSTLKSYKNHLIGIFLFFENKHPEAITSADIQEYLLHQIKFKKISESTQNAIINSIKAYWEKALKRDKTFIEIPRPKKPKQLPNVFSQEEVIQLIESPKNLKHKLILLLIYSAGLRLSELVNIRVKDISLHRRTIFIKKSKGKKDRFVILADEVTPFLDAYKKQYRPIYWLIEGQTGGQYSSSSVQKIFRIALETSKVFAYGTVHTLRHSYATHCVENGFSVALLQEALGHGSIKTTEKYLHISNDALRKLRSPLDIIKNKGKNK